MGLFDRDPSDPMTGRLLDGRYEIGGRIARGGMASVYEARDIRLDRVVAVKVMHPGMGDDEEFARRFVREARAAARLSHPNVVAVFDQGDEDGTVFLAMEYVPGHTLRDVIRKESPMAPAKALAILDPVLSALAAAHKAGLIHRDVKPENVLIADDGRVKVADFGLAKAVNSDTQHTATSGVLIGTVSYLAPELVVDGKADARADVYAAGVMLFELLTGRKPHEGETPIQVAYKHVHEDIPPPSQQVRGGLPAYVDALVARATARDRSHRPADARVLLHQVHRVTQALDEGVYDDPDLVADLRPPIGVSTATGELEQHFDEQVDLYEGEPTGEMPKADGPSLTSRIDPRPLIAGVTGMIPGIGGGGPDTAETTLPPPPPPQEDRRSRGPWVVIGAVVMVLAIVFGTWYFAFARYTTTPGVIGLGEKAAEKKIEQAGLGYDEGDPEYSETVPAGSVIRTDPEPGDRIAEDGTVTVTLSLGAERYKVPRVTGLSEDEAQLKIVEHFEFDETVEKYHPEIPEGEAIGTNPRAGTSLAPTAAVTLIMSKGPRPIKIPDFTGKDAVKAEAKLIDLGFEVNKSTAYNDDVDEGRVISQSPDEGTGAKGDTIDLVISLGPELVEVPRVIGSGVEAATDRLEDAGFDVDVQRHDDYVGLGYVVGCDPTQGTDAPRGSTITLTVI